MSSITEFLLARIAEDEAEAREWERDVSPSYPSLTYPERVIAECQAKRDIIAEYPMQPRHVYERTLAQAEATEVLAGWDIPRALLILAAVYADHPDYDNSWRV